MPPLPPIPPEKFLKSSEALDRLFDSFEQNVALARQKGLPQADRMEREFFPLHDKALKAHAAFIDSLRNTRDRVVILSKQAEMSKVIDEICVLIADLSASVGRTIDERERRRD